MRLASYLSLLVAAGLVAAEGYTDTPIIPGTQWHVHDSTRPQPPRAELSKLKCNEAPAPAGAIVLFDGKDAATEWEPDTVTHAKPSKAAPTLWLVKDGAMIARGNGIRTKRAFGDLTLHARQRGRRDLVRSLRSAVQGR